jgi:hypothetical protein
VAKRTAGEIYAAARQAGLSAPSAVIATAIALAESGGDDRVLGDTTIQGGGWGPSVGVFQIRTRTEQYGTGGDRDLLALQGNLARQAVAMRNISAGGTNWAPWTVYTRGTYQDFLGQAQSAAAGAGADVTGVQTVGLGDTAQDIAGAAVDSARRLLVKLGAAGLGVVLIGVGVVLAVKQRLQTQSGKAAAVLGGGGNG